MTTLTDTRILKRLEEMEASDGGLPRLLQFYRKLLGIQAETTAQLQVPVAILDHATASQRTGSGLPLLTFDELAIDWPRLQEILEKTVSLLASYPDVFGNLPRQLTQLVDDSELLKTSARAWFEGKERPASMATEAEVALSEFALGAAFKPFLVNHAERLQDLVDQENWRRGQCPVCGGSPDFAFLERETGARRLLCARCDSQWLFQRLECPACGNQEHSTLAYFTDDNGLYRLYVCEKCHHYLKAIDLRRAEREVLLPLERYLTLDLDIQAQTNGYQSLPHDKQNIRRRQPLKSV